MTSAGTVIADVTGDGAATAGPLRLACDTGGTFTDLVVEAADGTLRFFKSPTTPANPIEGLLEVLQVAANGLAISVGELLGSASAFIHGTTRALNAMVTGETARTALLVTAGHPDILLFRDGGERFPAFDYTRPYPEPFVPRRLTFEVSERIGVDGSTVRPLDEDGLRRTVSTLAERGVEAVAVCLLWSIVEPAHEIRAGEILEQDLPGVPFTLSHRLNPTIREHRRACAASVDAALKPLMTEYLGNLERALVSGGFRGKLLLLTSSGGMLDSRDAREAPIHVLGSGPAAAPIAARHYTREDGANQIGVVGDAGGTTFDVAVVRGDEIPRTAETLIGDPYVGTPTGFPSVDVRSVGAGGGSIAWVDEGGLLHVGPQSAGASPGPACYLQGGSEATVTDACLALGYIDPTGFLGGAMDVSSEFAHEAIARSVAEPLGIENDAAAEAIVALACERMAAKIEEQTVSQGIDPRRVTFVGGGGGAGLYAVPVARRLRIERILLPDVAPALSAAGALLSKLEAEYQHVAPMTTDRFDRDRANAALADLAESCREFLATVGASAVDSRIRFTVDARYVEQLHEIEVPLESEEIASAEDVERLHGRFHRIHREMFAVDDSSSEVEVVSFRARVAATVRPPGPLRVEVPVREGAPHRAERQALFDGSWLPVTVWQRAALPDARRIDGPVIVESALDTVVVPPGAAVERSAAAGWITIDPAAGEAL